MCAKKSKPVIATRVPVSEEITATIAWQAKAQDVVSAAQNALSTAEALKRDTDDVVCGAIAAWLLVHPEALDDDIRSMLKRSNLTLEKVLECLELGYWECSTSPTGKCVYSNELGDDHCLFCGLPEERK